MCVCVCRMTDREHDAALGHACALPKPREAKKEKQREEKQMFRHVLFIRPDSQHSAAPLVWSWVVTCTRTHTHTHTHRHTHRHTLSLSLSFSLFPSLPPSLSGGRDGTETWQQAGGDRVRGKTEELKDWGCGCRCVFSNGVHA